MSNEYINTKNAVLLLQVTPKTLRLWDKEHKIRTIRTPSGIRRYNKQDIQNILDGGCFTQKNGNTEKQKICYARVSSQKQMDDLDRQTNFFKCSLSWSQMLLRELTGNVKVFFPFWTPQCTEISQKLWLPTETDYQDSLLNYSNGSLKKMESNSWFSTETIINQKNKNSQMTSCRKNSYRLYLE
jgi:DNA-binding transcriptional MerR regulator